MISKLKKVTLTDLFGIIKYLVVFIPALIYHIILKISGKKLWLICETKTTARDNGYVFYNYMIKKHPEVKTYYAISKECNDYKKFKDKTNIINWGSLKHYFLYCAATNNISSHKEGNPNQTLFTIMHLYLHLYNNRIFLQHGITYQFHNMFRKKNTRFKMVISASPIEAQYLKERFGYQDEVKLTGFARFDNLILKETKKIILFIPTWRRFITNEKELLDTLYYHRLNNLLNSDNLEELLNKYGYELHFLPHQGLDKIGYQFTSKLNNIKILDHKCSDVQKLMIESAMMITDFSSVQFDFAYMKKPVLYYQFDRNTFYKYHINASIKDSYMDYKNMTFGPVAKNEEELLSLIEQRLQQDCEIDNKYLTNIDSFFGYFDKNNCERIYRAIIGDAHEK